MKKQPKAKRITTWHVFSDGIDGWFCTLREATEAYRQLAKDGYRNRRIYREQSSTDNLEVREDCVRSAGDFPY